MTTKIITYLTFDGNCREAMTFYQEVFDAELNIKTFNEAPPDICPPSDRVMHAHLQKGDLVLMASDIMPGTPFVHGTDFSLSMACSSAEEQDRYFAALSAGGQVHMPIQEMFWGARFGMLQDKFGFRWMLDVELPKH